MIYLEVFVVTLLLFVLMRTLAYVTRVYISSARLKMAFVRIIPVLELVLWGIWVFWAADRLFQNAFLYQLFTGSALVLILIIFGWYFLRDYIAGILLKSETTLEPGQEVHSGDVKGVIRKVGLRSLELVTTGGETIKLPYSVMSTRLFSKNQGKRKWSEQKLIMVVPALHNPEKIRMELKRRLLEMSWLPVPEKVDINIEAGEGTTYRVVVLYYVLNDEMALKTEKVLRDFIAVTFTV